MTKVMKGAFVQLNTSRLVSRYQQSARERSSRYQHVPVECNETSWTRFEIAANERRTIIEEEMPEILNARSCEIAVLGHRRLIYQNPQKVRWRLLEIELHASCIGRLTLHELHKVRLTLIQPHKATTYVSLKFNTVSLRICQSYYKISLVVRCQKLLLQSFTVAKQSLWSRPRLNGTLRILDKANIHESVRIITGVDASTKTLLYRSNTRCH